MSAFNLICLQSSLPFSTWCVCVFFFFLFFFFATFCGFGFMFSTFLCCGLTNFLEMFAGTTGLGLVLVLVLVLVLSLHTGYFLASLGLPYTCLDIDMVLKR